MSDSIVMPTSGKRRAAKHKPRVTDGIKHPVTVTNKRERTLEQAADTLTTVLMAALDTSAPAKSDDFDYEAARMAAQAPLGTHGTCACGAAVTKVWHPSFGARTLPRWLHDADHEGCSMVRSVRVA